MTVRDWLLGAEARLESESARLEAQLLLGHALSRDRSWLLAHPEEPIDSGPADHLLTRRLVGEPLAYVLGYREFYGRRFEVGPGVLIPRHETEGLVEAGLEAIDRGRMHVLDLCCGSGAIGVTLKLERPVASVAMSDISPVALDYTARNAEALGAGVEIVKSDAFKQLTFRKFDLIVSNPPYIARDEILEPEVAQYEPEEALYADEKGLAFHRVIATLAREHLNSFGEIWVEVGYTQSESVKILFQELDWQFLEGRLDLLGHLRVLGFRGA